jgi:hypothetical protein
MFRYQTFRIGKMLPLGVILAVLLAGVWIFIKFQPLISHQHMYYLPTYAKLLRYDIDQIFSSQPTTADSSDPGYARSVPVLVYHGLLPKTSGENISLDEFTDQMLTLKKAGYHTVSIQDFYDFMHNGKKLPAKSVLLTFDDGRKDSYYPANPVLKTLGFKAVMYVITKASFPDPGSKYVNSKYYLNQAELLQMKKSGTWEPQSHAAYGHFLIPIDAKGDQGHYYDSKEWLTSQHRLETDQEFADRVIGDLKLAQHDMQHYLGITSISFAFPFNEFGTQSANYTNAQHILADAVSREFKVNFYQIWPNKGSTQNFPEEIGTYNKRILMDNTLPAPKLMQLLADTSPKPVPYALSSNDKASWLSTWGSFNWNRSAVTVTANDTGGTMFLDGARDWQNYEVSGHMKLEGGDWFKLMLRYQDENNYISCTYLPNAVLMEYTRYGDTHTLVEVDDIHVPIGDLTAEGKVRNNTFTCGFNGQNLSSTADLPSDLGYGSIGFEAWGAQTHQAKLEVSNLTVSPLP